MRSAPGAVPGRGDGDAMSGGSPTPLQLEVRAELFSQLAAMEDAGLPFDTALRLVELPPRERPRLERTRKLIRLGIADAGLKGGLFTSMEASVLRAATAAGSPSRTLHLLADRYARGAARAKAIRSRMLLPVLMLVIAVLVSPLPGLVAGTLSWGRYGLKYVLPWIAAGGAAYLLGAPSRRGPLAYALRNDLRRVLSLVPLLGPAQARRNVRDFFAALALLLEAGMPILDALPIASGTVASPTLGRQLAQLGPRIEAGASFAQAVAELSFPGHARACALIVTGEASGALPQMLFRYAEAETAAIDRFDDLVAEWVPRLAYAAAASWIAYAIIRSGAFMPPLPQDLR
jgi:general secretion pathway protein F